MAEDDLDAPKDPTTPTRRIMIMISVVLGSTLYSTTLLIASTLLPQMQGAMAATQDEIAWAMTFNILATAVVTPMTGWLVARFGRRNVMVGSMLCFSLFTYLCGEAESLETLVLWRILQGAAGAPVVPLSQTILFDSFPRRQHRMITSVYGMAGPTCTAGAGRSSCWCRLGLSRRSGCGSACCGTRHSAARGSTGSVS